MQTNVYTFSKDFTSEEVAALSKEGCHRLYDEHKCDMLSLVEFEWHFNNGCLPLEDILIKIVQE